MLETQIGKQIGKWTGRSLTLSLIGLGLGLSAASPAAAETVEVEVENLAPNQGVFLTPVFVGFHDGSGDLYDQGSAVSDGFERLAEDGSTSFLADEFTSADSSRVATAVPGGLGEFPPPAVLGPGQTRSTTVELDENDNRFLSYASMVIPSNDAFIGNDDPEALEVIDEDGNVQEIEFTVPGSAVLDAGTEANNEQNAAFLNQSTADAGTETDGVVTEHEGFNGSVANPDDTPVNILGGTNPNGVSFGQTAADFTTDNYQILRLSVNQVDDATVIPSPTAAMLGVFMLGGMALRRPKQRRS